MNNSVDFDQIINEAATRLRSLIAQRDRLADQQAQIAAVVADIQKRQAQLDLFSYPEKVGVPLESAQREVQYPGARPKAKIGRPLAETSKRLLECLASRKSATADELALHAGLPAKKARSRAHRYTHAGYLRVVTIQTKRVVLAHRVPVYELTEQGRELVSTLREQDMSKDSRTSPGAGKGH